MIIVLRWCTYVNKRDLLFSFIKIRVLTNTPSIPQWYLKLSISISNIRPTGVTAPNCSKLICTTKCCSWQLEWFQGFNFNCRTLTYQQTEFLTNFLFKCHQDEVKTNSWMKVNEMEILFCCTKKGVTHVNESLEQNFRKYTSLSFMV